jgi:CheY-like chemotaxis protein
MKELKILLVEDDQTISTVLAYYMNQFGHEVVGLAVDGPSAVELAANLLPDLLLMDIKLEGGMSGIEAAQAIRATSAVAPIVFVTGNTDPAHRDRAMSVSNSYLVTKPFTREDILATIRQAIPA